MRNSSKRWVPHRCYTERAIPTKHPRHAITETPPVRAALDELRGELGAARIEFSELLILGAQEKPAPGPPANGRPVPGQAGGHPLPPRPLGGAHPPPRPPARPGRRRRGAPFGL